MITSACRGRHRVAAPLIVLLGLTASLPACGSDKSRPVEIYGFAMVDYIQDSKRVDPSWLDAFQPSRIADPEGAPLDFKFETHMFGVGAEPTGLVFVRTPQIRVTPYRNETSHFSLAIERPSNDVDPGNIRLVEAYESSVIRGHQAIPDLTAQYRIDGTYGHLQAAALLRRIGFEYQISPSEMFAKSSETGWGISLSGAWKTTEKDRLLLQAVLGDGIATYMNDGGMDLAPNVVFNPKGLTPGFKAEAVRLTGVSAYYDHYWNTPLSTSLGYSFTKVDNTNFQSVNAFQRGDYASVNLLAYPVDRLMLGGELLWGELKDRGGGIGNDMRFQFSAKYNFSISP